MKTIFEHIAYAKEKPYHIRKRIAFGTAALGSGLIALVWLVGSLSLGVFAIQGSTFAENTEQPSVVTAPERGTQNIAGAAAILQDTDAPARIEIVDAAASTPVKNKVEQTTIHF